MRVTSAQRQLTASEKLSISATKFYRAHTAAVDARIGFYRYTDTDTEPFRLLHVFYIHKQSYKNVTVDFVFVTRSMQSVKLCSCCCFSAHHSHFTCFLQARGCFCDKFRTLN